MKVPASQKSQIKESNQNEHVNQRKVKIEPGPHSLKKNQMHTL